MVVQRAFSNKVVSEKTQNHEIYLDFLIKKLTDKSPPKNDNEQKFVNILSCLLPVLDFF